MFVVDTNIFLYAAEKSFSEHKRCRELVQEWREQPAIWHTTWSILYEFVRVATHASVFKKPWSVAHAWEFVTALLASPSLLVIVETDRHHDVAKDLLDELPRGGNIIHDAHIVALMREHGIQRIYTRDTDFHRFKKIEVIDPLR